MPEKTFASIDAFGTQLKACGDADVVLSADTVKPNPRLESAKRIWICRGVLHRDAVFAIINVYDGGGIYRTAHILPAGTESSLARRINLRAGSCAREVGLNGYAVAVRVLVAERPTATESKVIKVNAAYVAGRRERVADNV